MQPTINVPITMGLFRDKTVSAVIESVLTNVYSPELVSFDYMRSGEVLLTTK